jgi:tetratricopeptide (TPR) repeat protein
MVLALGAVAALGAVGAQSSLTFNRDIAPIIWARCSPCHRPGEVGPFSLITYDDVKQRAGLIASATSRRIMPPWKPERGKGEFEGDRTLSDRELQAIQQWVAHGAVEGDPGDLKSPPNWNAGWQLGQPDLVVSMPEPYFVPPGGGDVFRTFVIPIPSSRPRYVRALEFRPGNARVVHHANLGIDHTRSSRRLDLQDPEPGYVGGMVPDARYPEGQLLGWTPGQAPHPVPPGMQWRLEADSDLVVQLHLQPTGKREPLQLSVGFFFTDDPPASTPVGLRLGSETIDIPAAERNYVVTDRYVLPVDVEVWAVQPHAHNLARRMEAAATKPDGTRLWLISIADWDFRWQDVYRYAKPFLLPKGTTISMRYEYDNSADNVRNPRNPPARVVWGQSTTDEMGDLWIQVVPRTRADLTALNADFRKKAHAEDLAAYTKVLREDPANPLRHDAVASLYFEEGRVGEAISHYRQSLALNPESASTHYNLGIALALRGVRGDAISEFRDAIRIDPGYAQAHNNLGATLQAAGQIDEALDHYRRAVSLQPDNVDARLNLGQLLSSMGESADAAEQFSKVLALQTDHPRALSGLAWIRATAAQADLRDAALAIELGERAVSLTSRRDVSALDALAAAYASAGRFDDAVGVARRGVELATTAGMEAVAVQFRVRLALYEQRRPYRMPQP